MAKSISTSGFGNEFTNADFVGSLGRIGGKLLDKNLLRNEIDLAFDTNLVYLKVVKPTNPNPAVGIKKENPGFDLDINSDIYSKKINFTDSALIDKLNFNSPNTILVTSGDIELNLTGSDRTFLFDKITSGPLFLETNKITSINDSDLILSADQNKIIDLLTDVEVNASLSVKGNITLDGNLTAIERVVLGDNELDVVEIAPSLSQTLRPSENDEFDIGKEDRKWKDFHAFNWQYIENLYPKTAIVNASLSINGFINKINPITANSDLTLSPFTGITYIEDVKVQDSTLTNLLNTPLTLKTTGIGYVVFVGTNGMIVPAGNSAQIPVAPELGDTRWNTQLNRLECWNGTEYVVATGPSENVTVDEFIDLVDVYTLIFG